MKLIPNEFGFIKEAAYRCINHSHRPSEDLKLLPLTNQIEDPKLSFSSQNDSISTKFGRLLKWYKENGNKLSENKLLRNLSI